MVRVLITNPKTGARDLYLDIGGAVVMTARYTNGLHRHVSTLITRMDEALTVIKEFNVDKLIPKMVDVCNECGCRSKSKAFDMVISFRANHIDSGAWSILVEEQGWIPTNTWIEEDNPNGIWHTFKKVVK